MNTAANGRSMADVISSMKDEAVQFAQTRFLLFKTETQQKLVLLKIAAVLAVAAVLFLGTAYFLLTFAVVAAVAGALAQNPYHWFFGFLTVGLLWSILGAVAAFFAKREFAARSIVPTRTISVLKGDKIWIQSEARNQL
jgi:membrane protein implicated in regulation of membrane protease activity